MSRTVCAHGLGTGRPSSVRTGGVFPPFRLLGGCQWPALQLCVLRGVLGRRTHSEGRVRCNFRLGKSSCCVCGLLASVSLASDRESGAKAESCFVDSSGTRS